MINTLQRSACRERCGLAGLFPEVAAAKTPKAQPLPRLQNQVVALVKRDKKTLSVLSKYSGYTFGWDNAAATLDETVARVDVIGTNEATKAAVFLTIFVNTVTAKILFVQHASVLGEREGSSRLAKLIIRVDDEKPDWEGSFTKNGGLVPNQNYPTLKKLKTLKQPNSCKSKVGTVCDYAAAGDSILACAVLATTGPGAVACGFALLIISIYGCSKLTHMICD